MRFELTNEMIQALKDGAILSAGIDHPAYRQTVNPIAANIVKSLIQDLD